MTADVANRRGTPTRGAVGTAADLLEAVLEDPVERQRHPPLPTGFPVLDDALGGGAHPGDLIVVAGVPGVGKTVLTLQWAAALARAGATAVHLSYEHDDLTLLQRLLTLEISRAGGGQRGDEVERILTGRSGVDGDALRRFAAAAERVRTYGDRLWLLGADRCIGLPALEELAAVMPAGRTVLFVDYLQRVPARPHDSGEGAAVGRLKEIASRHGLAIVAVAAAEREGLRTLRLLPYHLQDAATIAYEADVILTLNEKSRCVAKAHVAYDPVRAETFHHYVVVTIDKNRRGPAGGHIEFRKDFANQGFDPSGRHVAERLVDERFHE